ncbi:hypothetical protein Ab1vBOLIVR5_gp42c [Agrobacterium phage OLIVR5]|uniref:Uncharacterized protein n=1 Tax=Agrobacterium phage OLIVR5 TaxID=2723773 RepID=A0A858MUV4_9CAUD|nr:hypothetical protein KNU99_gp042 [Agrobacterium phage OLIVR5]QIW87690.1 hypothetical protein Ab1vBOLIVR5_gp42c [Agrobacterium phage OLIVR5]QIW87952.1 hypothetical protein Ab1vBOLIVR6_gp45c [Agrobacterium phage OLIVR6]
MALEGITCKLRTFFVESSLPVYGKFGTLDPNTLVSSGRNPSDAISYQNGAPCFPTQKVEPRASEFMEIAHSLYSSVAWMLIYFCPY